MKFSQVHCASFSNFFYIVLQKWIYSCFSKLVQNKYFGRRSRSCFHISWKPPGDFAQMEGDFFRSHPSPVSKRFLATPSCDKLSPAYDTWAPTQASLAPRALDSTCTWSGFPKFTLPRFTDNFKIFFTNFWENLLREMSFCTWCRRIHSL